MNLVPIWPLCTQKPAFEPQLQLTLTCPHVRVKTMPTNACHWYYECSACHTLLKPETGNCCVFCCYGSVPCLRFSCNHSNSNNSNKIQASTPR
ncbi:MAG: GDCCVxC domain-containing (seleno)protein [Pseudomonadota bacterium]